MIKKFFLLLGLAVPNLGWCTSALQDRECNQAIRAVAEFVAPEKHKHKYYCGLYEQSAGYFVFRLNSRYPAPDVPVLTGLAVT